MLENGRLQFQIGASFLVAGLYLLSNLLVWLAVVPLQRDLVPDVFPYAILFYLPHGVRVLATAVIGPRAIPALVLAEMSSNWLLWGMADPWLLIAVSVVGGGITWVAFQVLQVLGVNAFYLSSIDKLPSLTTLLLAGLVASILNALALTAINTHAAPVAAPPLVMVALVVGDMTGLFMVILFTKLVVGILRPKS